MARPLVAPSAALSRVVTFRLTPGEHADLAAAAQRAGVSVAELARATCLGGAVVVSVAGPAAVKARARADERAQLRREINALGVNLNQIARKLHTLHEHVPADVTEACTAVTAALLKLL